MKEIQYIITDPCGIHARLAGQLVRLAQNYEAETEIFRGEKHSSVKNLLNLMSLGIRQGETVVVQVTGADEEACAVAIEAFFQEKL